MKTLLTLMLLSFYSCKDFSCDKNKDDLNHTGIYHTKKTEVNPENANEKHYTMCTSTQEISNVYTDKQLQALVKKAFKNNPVEKGPCLEKDMNFVCEIIQNPLKLHKQLKLKTKIYMQIHPETKDVLLKGDLYNQLIKSFKTDCVDKMKGTPRVLVEDRCNEKSR
jgi:hypothetical protein